MSLDTVDASARSREAVHPLSQQRVGRGWFLPSLTVLFFCSGVSALVYQVLWMRVLGWVFGVTVYAASTVWASFMAGLSIGSVAAGTLADRVRSPLRWFGITELLIGVTAMSTPAALRLLQQTFMTLYPSLPHSLAALTIARFAIAFAVLIVPTALMGATLPLVIKSSDFRRGRLGEHIGLLYGSNTAGAIVGTIAAGLYLIPGRGIHGTFLTASGLNLAVGLVAVGLAAAVSRVETPAAQSEVAPRPAADYAGLTDRRLRVVLGVFGVSGAVSLALEVVWFRVLTLFLRPTVYGFAVMLATVLAGIAIGSYIVTPLLQRRRRWVGVLAGVELMIGASVILSFRPLAELPGLTVKLTPTLSRLIPEYLVYPLVGSLLAIFPTTLLMGLAFPIGLRVWAGGARERSEVSAERIGIFYSLNVAGAIFGSLLAGFVLLPRLGSRTALVGLAAVSLGSGLALLLMSEWRRTTRVVWGATSSALFMFAAWHSPDPFDQFVSQRYPRERIIWREEGIAATVVVHQARDGVLKLTVNGNHEASTDEATAYVHRRIGHLPMALHPDARTALVVGLGGGATAGAVSIHTGVHVDVVELAEAVVHGARFFDAINYDVLSRPNVRLRVDDGRNYLMLTPHRYDVVTADVIHPIFAGSGNLYSVEYFRLVRRVLNPGGMVLQWVAGTDAEYKLIARTFLSVFPETTVWADGSLLVGMVDPLRLRRRDFNRKLDTSGNRQGLRDLNVESFDRLLAAFIAGPDELRTFVGAGPILTDDRPLVEYFLSLPRDRDVDLSALKGDVQRYVVAE